MALPKATVQLQAPTQPLGTSFSQTSTATAAALDEEEEEVENEGLANILSIVGFVAALIVLAFQLMTANVWVNSPNSPSPGDGWSQLFQ
ncbi:MAG: hypothetical protein EOP88_00825 [Verrucomicrobiaceae bacterium]|nr:MAG: hypothetical protein EOP88_00825 [Verrucomicrobiaceae bacterium]